MHNYRVIISTNKISFINKLRASWKENFVQRKGSVHILYNADGVGVG